MQKSASNAPGMYGKFKKKENGTEQRNTNIACD